MSHVISSSFFSRPTLQVARKLLGKYLVRRTGHTVLSGKISEVEAYIGERDLACHASKGRTKRTEVLYGKPGTLYVYLVYGMYWCLNIVTEQKDYPAAVLIRSVIPVQGIEAMTKNRMRYRSKEIAHLDAVGGTGEKRNKPYVNATALSTGAGNEEMRRMRNFFNGPGKLCQAFGITGTMNGKKLGRDTLTIEDRGEGVPSSRIKALPRIGVDYAKHCAAYPWRFVLR